MLGMDSDKMSMISMSLGAALAGLAAVTIFPLGSITVESGYSVLIYAVAVCIVGGLGSWPGAVVAASSLAMGRFSPTSLLRHTIRPFLPWGLLSLRSF